MENDRTNRDLENVESKLYTYCPEALSRQIMILAARNAELLMALEDIARKKKMDAVAAASMKAIAISALRESGIRV